MFSKKALWEYKILPFILSAGLHGCLLSFPKIRVEQWLSNERDFVPRTPSLPPPPSPRGYVAMSGDIFGCHD